MSKDDRKDPLKHSRFKRLPQVWRIGQESSPKAVDPLGDEFRVTVYLTNAQADRAEKAAIETGMGDLQAWCQANLRRLISQIDSGMEIPRIPTIRAKTPASGPEINAEMDIPDDPEFLREWAGIPESTPALPSPAPASTLEPEELIPEVVHEMESSNFADDSILIQRLGLILECLRAGRRPSSNDVATVCQMLEQVGRETRTVDSLPKSLVRTLYRLSLESQVLITEVHPGLGLDLTVVTQVRQLQSAVGKIMDT